MAHDTPSGGAVPADLPYAPSGVSRMEALGADGSSPEYRADQVERALFEIHSEQSLAMGTAAGVIAGTVGAILWAAITIVTGFQIGWLAIGIGFMVGAAVRWSGRGTTSTFGVIGGTLALVSVAAGNFLSMLCVMADFAGVPYLEMFLSFDYSQTFALMAGTFGISDVVFYGIAVWQGYQCSIRVVMPEEIHDRLTAQGVTPLGRR